jgi:hypothetical protein
LDLLSVKEQTCDPFQVRVLSAVTDGVRTLAEVDVREERLSSFAGSTGTSKVVELTKVADTGRFDNTTAPPATTIDVSASLLSKDWRSSVGAACTTALFPATSFLSFVNTASFRTLSVNVSKESITF